MAAWAMEAVAMISKRHARARIASIYSSSGPEFAVWGIT
jgi:hypothetical protein